MVVRIWIYTAAEGVRENMISIGHEMQVPFGGKKRDAATVKMFCFEILKVKTISSFKA